jgi:hypothetical protein
MIASGKCSRLITPRRVRVLKLDGSGTMHRFSPTGLLRQNHVFTRSQLHPSPNAIGAAAHRESWSFSICSWALKPLGLSCRPKALLAMDATEIVTRRQFGMPVLLRASIADHAPDRAVIESPNDDSHIGLVSARAPMLTISYLSVTGRRGTQLTTIALPVLVRPGTRGPRSDTCMPWGCLPDRGRILIGAVNPATFATAI